PPISLSPWHASGLDKEVPTPHSLFFTFLLGKACHVSAMSDERYIWRSAPLMRLSDAARSAHQRPRDWRVGGAAGANTPDSHSADRTPDEVVDRLHLSVQFPCPLSSEEEHPVVHVL
ncbi:MAG: hypothetical protein ACPIOQ_26535, partial [Promethearchaeia archaeon]